jgi:hypothetical protein
LFEGSLAVEGVLCGRISLFSGVNIWEACGECWKWVDGSFAFAGLIVVPSPLLFTAMKLLIVVLDSFGRKREALPIEGVLCGIEGRLEGFEA